MMSRTLTPLVLSVVPAVGIGYQLTATDPTLAVLRNVGSSSLSTMRAGAPVVHSLAQADRAQLQRAERSSGDLAALRAGALTENEMLIIGITVLAVILLIIIL